MKKYLLFCLLLSGCLSTSKKVQKAEGVLLSVPGAASKFCVEKFPVVSDSVSKTDTLFIPADNVDYSHLIDSITGDYNDLINENNLYWKSTDSAKAGNYLTLLKLADERIKKLKAAYKPCKPDTLRFTTTKYLRYTAYEKFWQDKYEISDKQNIVLAHDYANKKHAFTSVLWIAIFLAVVASLLGLYAFKVGRR